LAVLASVLHLFHFQLLDMIGHMQGTSCLVSRLSA
jgi:hypothetical protein